MMARRALAGASRIAARLVKDRRQPGGRSCQTLAMAAGAMNPVRMRPITMVLATVGLVGWAGLGLVVGAGEVGREERRPGEFYSIFSFGYGGDDFPADLELFAKLVRKIAGEGQFNAIMCQYSDERAAICEDLGVKMLVDLLGPEAHVYRAPERAEELCVKLRGKPVVMGYHLWSDRIGGSGAGRARDIASVRGWDPTHATYSATYRMDGIGHLVGADIFGWYDFHWKRGVGRRFPHLLTGWRLARENDAVFYELLSTDSGLAGRGNFNRSLWSVNTGIACGMKGCLWFIGSRQMDARTGEWTAFGLDINRVNAEVMPLRGEIMGLGIPVAIYSTPVSLDMNNRPVSGGEGGAPVYPAGLEGHGFPDDLWVQVVAGEFLMGLFEAAGGGRSAFLANHNAYVEQEIELRLEGVEAASLFDRGTGAWRELGVEGGIVRLVLGAGGGELMRFE